MYRILITAILGVLMLQLSAQPKVPSLPARSKAIVPLPKDIELLNLHINSSFEETAPLISADGNTLYFTRRNHPQNFGRDKAGDIWMSKREVKHGDWSRPVNIGAPLNNVYYNAAVAIDPSGLVMYAVNNYTDQGEGLVWTKREGRSWTNPETCQIEDFYSKGDGASFQLSADGNYLLLGLEREDGYGRRDLYVSFRKGDFLWSAPLNLGRVINTSKEESKAFLAADGMSLYFASRGHGGKGGFDLFYSQRLDDSWTNWSEPENLGDGINSPFDDEYISLPATGDPAYLVYRDSNSHNLYTGHLPIHLRPQAVTLVRAKVNVKGGEATDQLRVTSLDLNDKQVPQTLPLHQDGTVTLVLPPGEERGLQVEAPGYFPLSTYLGGQGVDESLDADQGITLAATEMSPEYLERDGEIRNLRLRLNQVDAELAEMRAQRKEYLTQLKERNPALGEAQYSDPELDALRHRFTELNRPVVIDTIPVPKEKDWYEEESLIPEKDARRGTTDDELAAMKKRFNRFYQIKGGEQRAEEGQEEFLWEGAKGFADFQDEVRQQLTQELRQQVGSELAQELWPQVRASLQGSLDPKSMVILDEKEYEIREQIVQQLTEAAIHVGQSKIEMPTWQRNLEVELRTKMEPQIRMELEQALEEDIRTTLTHEAFYQIRQQESARLNSRLEEKIDQQIAEEQRQDISAIDVNSLTLGVKGGTSKVEKYQEEERELVLLSPEKGAIFPLNNVFFKPNTDQLKEISHVELDRVVAFLSQHSSLTVELATHTNGWLSHSLALQLSQKRAETLANYLFEHGIAEEQIQFRGYGKTKPIASNDTLEGRRKNQRVELRILEK